MTTGNNIVLYLSHRQPNPAFRGRGFVTDRRPPATIHEDDFAFKAAEAFIVSVKFLEEAD